MKKIIVAFVLFVSFSITANAQEIKKANSQEKEITSIETRKVDFNDLAKKETYKLVELLQLDQQMAKDLNGLFLYKHNQLNLAKNENEKKQISEQIEAKLRATFTAAQMEKITSQSNLLYKLTH
jgi:hypothetical protein